MTWVLSRIVVVFIEGILWRKRELAKLLQRRSRHGKAGGYLNTFVTDP